MSLQAKFAALVLMILTAVAGSLGAAVWSFQLLERETGRPAAEAAETAKRLGVVTEIVDQLTPIDPAPPMPDRYSEVARELAGANAGLDADGSLTKRVGRGAAGNLHQRLTTLADLVQKVGRSGEDARAAAVAAGEARKLLARAQARVLDEVDQTVGNADKIRVQLVGVLGFSMGSAILVGLLALILMRRWVIAPVARLRVATAAVARGDFTHRISAPGAGELAELSHEVDHMAGMVGWMQDERVERERLAATGEMVRRLAHNLRNPLSGIRGLAEVSLTELPHGSELRDNQSRIVAAVDRFERWLADLLNVTSPLRINPQPTAVRAWLAGVLTTQSPLARTRHIALVVDDAGAPEAATFDPRHLEHALVALVTNAIQATPERGTVRVTLGHDPEGAVWTIRVDDTGPGIPEALREKVFTPYFTTKKDGSGIGLPLARQIARSHGGDLRLVEGGAGDEVSGASIVIELPIEGLASPSAPPAPPSPGAVSGPGHPAEEPRAQNPRARGRRESATVNLADTGKSRP
jgi:signal transduction histidine kinase